MHDSCIRDDATNSSACSESMSNLSSLLLVGLALTPLWALVRVPVEVICEHTHANKRARVNIRDTDVSEKSLKKIQTKKNNLALPMVSRDFTVRLFGSFKQRLKQNYDIFWIL